MQGVSAAGLSRGQRRSRLGPGGTEIRESVGKRCSGEVVWTTGGLEGLTREGAGGCRQLPQELSPPYGQKGELEGDPKGGRPSEAGRRQLWVHSRAGPHGTVPPLLGTGDRVLLATHSP